MDQSQKEYTEYYEARMKKYENNPNYVNSYQTEKALYELMRDAPSKEAYQKKFFGEKLNVKNAIALVKDRETMQLNHFKEIKEDIRAQGPESILNQIDSAQDEAELTKLVSDLSQKNSIDISIDGFTDEFYSDFKILEDIEVARKAEVPDRWRSEQEAFIKSEIENGTKDWHEHVIPNAQQYDSDYQFNHDLIWEDRHRRRIPIPDESVKRRIEEHKVYRGLK